jgi:hypothetical protein
MTKNKCGPSSIRETYSSKMGLSKIRNLEHKYEATRTQLPRNADGAQSSIEKCLYHQRISIVEHDASLKGLEKTPMILDP